MLHSMTSVSRHWLTPGQISKKAQFKILIPSVLEFVRHNTLRVSPPPCALQQDRTKHSAMHPVPFQVQPSFTPPAAVSLPWRDRTPTPPRVASSHLPDGSTVISTEYRTYPMPSAPSVQSVETFSTSRAPSVTSGSAPSVSPTRRFGGFPQYHDPSSRLSPTHVHQYGSQAPSVTSSQASRPSTWQPTHPRVCLHARLCTLLRG